MSQDRHEENTPLQQEVSFPQNPPLISDEEVDRENDAVMQQIRQDPEFAALQTMVTTAMSNELPPADLPSESSSKEEGQKGKNLNADAPKTAPKAQVERFTFPGPDGKTIYAPAPHVPAVEYADKAILLTPPQHADIWDLWQKVMKDACQPMSDNIPLNVLAKGKVAAGTHIIDGFSTLVTLSGYLIKKLVCLLFGILLVATILAGWEGRQFALDHQIPSFGDYIRLAIPSVKWSRDTLRMPGTDSWHYDLNLNGFEKNWLETVLKDDVILEKKARERVQLELKQAIDKLSPPAYVKKLVDDEENKKSSYGGPFSLEISELRKGKIDSLQGHWIISNIDRIAEEMQAEKNKDISDAIKNNMKDGIFAKWETDRNKEMENFWYKPWHVAGAFGGSIFALFGFIFCLIGSLMPRPHSLIKEFTEKLLQFAEENQEKGLRRFIDINFSQEQLTFLVAVGRLVVVEGNIDSLVAKMRISLEQQWSIDKIHLKMPESPFCRLVNELRDCVLVEADQKVSNCPQTYGATTNTPDRRKSNHLGAGGIANPDTASNRV